MKRETTYIGTFENKTGRMIVSDPCYDHPHFEMVEKGFWDVEVEIFDEGSCGKHVSMLAASKKSELVDKWIVKKRILGVDSGQMAIVDYFDGFGEGEYDEPGSWYHEACEASLTKKKAGMVNWNGRKIGAVSSTGYGDGSYTLRVGFNEKGKIIALQAIFIEEADEDDDLG